MRTIWIASGVFLFGAIASAMQRRNDLALIFAAIGFQLVFVADSNVDWRHRITRRDWRKSVFEPRWQTTILGKLGQALGFVCLFFYFVVAFPH